MFFCHLLLVFRPGLGIPTRSCTNSCQNNVTRKIYIFCPTTTDQEFKVSFYWSSSFFYTASGVVKVFLAPCSFFKMAHWLKSYLQHEYLLSSQYTELPLLCWVSHRFKSSPQTLSECLCSEQSELSTGAPWQWSQCQDHCHSCTQHRSMTRKPS